MTPGEFGEQIERLKEVFGEKAYPDERTRLIFEAVRRLEPDDFSRIVDQFIGCSRQAPLLPEFRDAIASHCAPKTWEAPDYNRRPDCDYCHDLGTYLCTNPNLPGLWAFRCHCDAGCRDRKQHISQFKQAHADQGFAHFADAWDLKLARAKAIEAEVLT